MSTPTAHRLAQAAGVRRIVLDANGVTMSGLLSEPLLSMPRATVIALHGAGMTASYFHGPAHPDVSLLSAAPRLGYAVLALDRPGYGASARLLPDGQSLADQAHTVRAAVADFTARHDIGAALFLLGHSFGGKLALTLAAETQVCGPAFEAVEVSGCGHRYAPATAKVWTRNWGALRLYPPGTFAQAAALVDSPPERELADATRWPEVFAQVAARIRIPVRFSFADRELWWRTDAAALAELRELVSAAPEVTVARVPHAGHNVSLGWAARAYHMSALAFFERCLLHAIAEREGR